MPRLPPTLSIAFIAGLAIVGTHAFATPQMPASPSPTSASIKLDSAVLSISRDWAHIKYQIPGHGRQFREFRVLEHQAATLAKRYPFNARPLLWQGIVASEEAARASLFERLGYAKRARLLLERALVINPNAAHGGVWLSLGVLYARVPGFPFAFGSDSKARADLHRALELDPNGLDANYFYGDYLFSQGHYSRAMVVLEHGLQAAQDAQRPIWDTARRHQIRQLLSRIMQKKKHR